MVNYIARERVLFRELEQRVELPSELKGHVALREATLTDQARGAVDRWADCSCEREKAIESLRKLGPPSPNIKIHGVSSSSHDVGHQ